MEGVHETEARTARVHEIEAERSETFGDHLLVSQDIGNFLIRLHLRTSAQNHETC